MFKFEDCITKEEKSVMYAMVTGTKKDGKVIRNIESVEDGTPKTINAMLIKARKREK